MWCKYLLPNVNYVYYGLKSCIVSKTPPHSQIFSKIFWRRLFYKRTLNWSTAGHPRHPFFEALLFTGGIRGTHSRPVAFSGSYRWCREVIRFVAGWEGAAVEVVKALFCSTTQSSINYSNQTPLDKGKGVGIFKVVIKIVAKGILDKK